MSRDKIVFDEPALHHSKRIHPNSLFLLQFASQGVDVLAELSRAYHQDHHARPLFQGVMEAISSCYAYLPNAKAVFGTSLALEHWFASNEVGDIQGLNEHDRTSAAMNLTVVMLHQLYQVYQLQQRGVCLNRLARECRGMMGHSVGFVTAVLCALGHKQERFFETIQCFFRLLLCSVYRAELEYQSLRNDLQNAMKTHVYQVLLIRWHPLQKWIPLPSVLLSKNSMPPKRL